MALKLLHGPVRKDRRNDLEPTPKPGAPDCPSWLTEKAKETWHLLAPILDGMRIITQADRHGLELLCDSYAEYRKARETILKHGPTYESGTANGSIIRPRPEILIGSDAWKRVRMMLSEFGLTPASRSKIRVGADYREDPMEDFLKRGKRTT